MLISAFFVPKAETFCAQIPNLEAIKTEAHAVFQVVRCRGLHLPGTEGGRRSPFPSGVFPVLSCSFCQVLSIALDG